MASFLKNISKPHRKGLLFSALMCITLGIAPLSGEPHLIGKWRWILGGANGMAPLDWFDAAMHSAPFLLLGYFIFKILKDRKTGAEPKE
jgi:hypothetical protein